MGTQQDTIERVDRQFRGVEGLRRRPIGVLGPLPGPRVEEDMSIHSLSFRHRNLKGSAFNETWGAPSANADVLPTDLDGQFAFRMSRRVAFQKLKLSIDTFTFATQSVTLTLRKNGVATGVTVTISGTGDVNVPGSVVYNEDDKLSFVLNSPAELGDMLGTLSYELLPQ